MGLYPLSGNLSMYLLVDMLLYCYVTNKFFFFFPVVPPLVISMRLLLLIDATPTYGVS